MALDAVVHLLVEDHCFHVSESGEWRGGRRFIKPCPRGSLRLIECVDKDGVELDAAEVDCSDEVDESAVFSAVLFNRLIRFIGRDYAPSDASVSECIGL